jgi:ribosomal protein S18 acetylase RimI-like enzyme
MEPLEIVIRQATPADAGRLAGFAARTFSDNFAVYNRPEDMALYLARSYGPPQQLAEINHPDIRTILAEIDGWEAAFAQIRRGSAPRCVQGPAPIELWRFYVDQDWIGRGIALRLMRAVRTEAEALGCRTLWLGVWERNARAIAFYRKCGFVDVGSHGFELGTEVQTDRIMVCPLSELIA